MTDFIQKCSDIGAKTRVKTNFPAPAAVLVAVTARLGGSRSQLANRASVWHTRPIAAYQCLLFVSSHYPLIEHLRPQAQRMPGFVTCRSADMQLGR